MKTKPLSQIFGVLLFTAALALFGSGCASPPPHSFNSDYSQSLPTAPNYFIEDGDANSFTITASQGRPSSGAERVLDVKRAATAVAETEAKRRGWQNWQLDYIYERNEGWMHVVKAEVVRKNAVEYKAGQPDKQP